MATVALEGISKYFGTVPAVQELSCTIAGSAPMNFLPVQPADTPPMLQLVDTAYCFALPATTWAALECGLHSTRRYTLGLRPEHILLQPSPGEHLLPATITLLEPLGREVLLSVTCSPHLLKVLVPAPCWLAPDAPVWLNLSQGPHHFFDPHTGVAVV